MRTLVRAIGLVLLFGTPLAAQDTPLIARSGSGRPLVQPDGTYVFQHIPHSDIIFEGQIAPRLEEVAAFQVKMPSSGIHAWIGRIERLSLGEGGQGLLMPSQCAVRHPLKEIGLAIGGIARQAGFKGELRPGGSSSRS